MQKTTENKNEMATKRKKKQKKKSEIQNAHDFFEKKGKTYEHENNMQVNCNETYIRRDLRAYISNFFFL